jgi:NAD(P)-dependent dehydrogenase (short-subunit alcohol dehydrogenase family)
MTRHVVITGCSSGFGRVTALRLARRGWQVVATVRSAEAEAALRAEAAAQGSADQLAVVRCDITEAPDVARLAQAVAERTAALQALVNNAGTGYGGPIELLPLADVRRQLEVNVLGQVAVTQALLPLLKAARGTIVNVSSVGGRIAMPGMAPYHMSKFALEALSDSLRIEMAPFGVRVVVVEPGSSPTAIWDTSLSRAEDVLRRADEAGYGRLAAAVAQSARAAGRHGFPPERFAALVERILASPRPAARYVMPGGMRLVIALRQIAPDWLWDRFLRWRLRR